MFILASVIGALLLPIFDSGKLPFSSGLDVALFAFKTISNSTTDHNKNVTADLSDDLLEMVGGSGIAVVTDYALDRITITATGGGSSHNLLSATHPDTTPQTVSRGSLIAGIGGTPTWDELVIGGANTVLRSDGTDATWGQIADANIDATGITTRSKLPSAVAYEDEANTFTNVMQTFTDDDFRWQDNVGGQFYTVSTGDLVADRITSLPVLSANDVFVFTTESQTLTNKGIALGSNTITGTSADFDTAVSDDNIAYEGASNSWADGVKQTFNPDGTNAGINVGTHTAEPSSPASGDVFYDSTANQWKFRDSDSWEVLGGGSSHNLLSATHPDTTPQTVSRGSLIVGKTATPTWDELVIGGANTVLASDGTDATWTTLGKTHLPSAIAYEDEANTFTNVMQTFTDDDFRWQDNVGGQFYTVSTGDLVADRITSLPVLSANDVFVFTTETQTLTNKGIDCDSNTCTNIESADMKTAVYGNIQGLATQTQNLDMGGFDIIALGATDGAEAGALRLANNEQIAWEASPAGTDLFISVDASENFIFDSNIVNIETNSNPIANPVIADSLNANSQNIDAVNDITMQGRFKLDKGGDIASGDAITLGADGNFFDITGTTTINHIMNTNWQIGSIIGLQFDGALTLTHLAGGLTGDKTNLDLIGNANYLTSAGDIKFFILHDATTFQEISRNIDNSGSGSQTPWISDIDADGFDLNDLSNILFRTTTGAPTATDRAIWYDDTVGMIFNALTGDVFKVRVNNVDQLTVDASTVDTHGNTIQIVSADQTIQDNAGSLEYDVATGESHSMRINNVAEFVVDGTNINHGDQVLTNTDIDCDGSGNSCANVDSLDIIGVAEPRSIMLMCGDAYLYATNTAPKTTIDGTNHDYVVCDFDTTTAETIEFVFIMPDNFDSTANLDAQVYFQVASGTAGVCFDISFLDLASGGTVDGSFTAVQGGCDSSTGTNTLEVATIAFTSAQHSIDAGDVVFAKLARDVADAGDTNANDARFIALELKWQ